MNQPKNFADFLAEHGEKYLQFLAFRLASSSVEFATGVNLNDEKLTQEVENLQGIIMLEENTLAAINYAFTTDEPLLPKFIQTIGELVDPDINANWGNGNYRRTKVMAGNLEFPEPKYIFQHIYNLIDNYNKLWCDLDPYEREAHFHINFWHTHPFEDANSRVARILTAVNLYRQGQIPFVITSKERERYLEYRKNKDIVNMTILFKELAAKEKILIDHYAVFNKMAEDDGHAFKKIFFLDNRKRRMYDRLVAKGDIRGLDKLFKILAQKEDATLNRILEDIEVSKKR